LKRNGSIFLPERDNQINQEPVIIGGRNIYKAEELKYNGFEHYCIGRQDIRIAPE